MSDNFQFSTFAQTIAIVDSLLQLEEKLMSFGFIMRDNRSIFTFGARLASVDSCEDIASSIVNIVHDLT